MKKQPKIILQLFSLFSVIRIYNILVIILAIYLASIYILAPQLRLKAILLDNNLFLLTLASALSIAGGYIINNFYDSKKDSINRPLKQLIDTKISQETKLKIYFLFNFIAFGLGFLVSYRAALFFAVYIFWIWFYSHKLKRIVFVGNIVAATLAIIPFFAVFLYYRNIHLLIVIHAAFLFTILLVREIVKDLENIKGDLSSEYHTIPIDYGIQKAKLITIILLIISLAPIYYLSSFNAIGNMKYYFYLVAIFIPVYSALLYLSNTEKQYKKLHLLLKFIIFLGVISIMFIDSTIIIDAIERRVS